MQSDKQYPRVLLVLMTKVMADDPGNLLIRAQFGNWPKASIAQIHASGDPAGSGEFCGSYYRLQKCDRLFGVVFQRLRSSVFEMVSMDRIQDNGKVQPAGPLRRSVKMLRKQIGDWLIGTGLWEVIFHVRLSEPMAAFVEGFKPDLIYCQGYSFGFATLPLLIARRLGIPICFQTTDDWPSYTYRGFPMGWLLRFRARQLVVAAKLRLAFGEKMRKVYEKRYGVPFIATYHLDDPRRFPTAASVDTEPCRVVYIGSLGLRRYEAVQDLLAVVRNMNSHQNSIQILIYSSGIPKDTPRDILGSPEVVLLPLPTHDKLPGILASASVLFLPESFGVAPEQIELAISSKAHLYMMSGRPILVYGPPYGGTVGYALEGGWADVITERNRTALQVSLTRLLHDQDRNRAFNRKASASADRNHNVVCGRSRFLRALEGVVVRV